MYRNIQDQNQSKNILLTQATSEKMCRLYEDQMNEAKAKAEELQRQLNESSTHRNRAQTESGEEPCHWP